MECPVNYEAITIDTQVIRANGFDFDNGLLAQLKQFAGGPTRVVVSQVVASEILKQLKEKVEETVNAIHAAHRDAVRYGLRSSEEQAFDIEPDIAAIGRKRIGTYFKEIGAEIIAYDNVKMEEVLNKYFHAAPPFTKVGKKKAE